jgi:hypothetical protein
MLPAALPCLPDLVWPELDATPSVTLITLLVTVAIVTAAHNFVVGAQPRLKDEALWSAGRLLLTVAAAIIMSALQRVIGH